MRYILFLFIIFSISLQVNSEGKKFIWGIWYNSYQKPYITFKEKNDKNLFSEQLKFFKSIGINRIYFLVKFPTGEVFYNSKIAPRHADLDWDPFAHIVNECKKFGIEIYPYVNIFPEGGYNEVTKKHDLIGDYLKKYPQYAMKDAKGKMYGWASPAIEAVVKYQLSILEEIAKKYAVDGIQLDRIRYPHNAIGYNPISVALYKKRYKKEVKEKDKDWTKFRQELLTQFVVRARKVIRAVNPKIKISAAVFPRPFSASVNQLQDWAVWCKKGLLEEIVPMTYYRDVKNFKKYLQQDLDVTPKETPLLAGIGTFFIKDPGIMDAQIRFAIKKKVHGVVFFNGYHLLDKAFSKIVTKYSLKK